MNKKSSKTKKVIATSDKDVEKVIQGVAENLLKLLKVNAKCEVKEDIDNSVYLVNIEAPEESGLLIGNRGRTMLDFQTIIGMIVKRKTDSWNRIVVNIGDWREKESRKLEELAKQAAERATETGEPQFLFNLSPSQRRTIHMYLSNFKAVDTKSEGEGEGRYLIVSPK